MLSLVSLAPVAVLSVLLGDAPNPADCPHHDCGYSGTDSGSLSVLAIVAIVVLVALAVGLIVIARRRRAG